MRGIDTTINSVAGLSSRNWRPEGELGAILSNTVRNTISHVIVYTVLIGNSEEEEEEHG